MKSLFLRILALLMGSFIAVVVSSYFLFSWINHEIHPGESRLHHDSLQIAKQIVSAYSQGTLEMIRARLHRRHMLRSWILDQTDRPLTGAPLPPEIRRQLTMYPMVIRPGQNQAGGLFLFGHEIALNGQNYRVVLAAPRPPFSPGGKFRTFGMPIIAVGLGLLIASALLSFWILRPMRAFRDTVGSISAENLSARIPNSVAGRSDAFGEFGREFNRMTDRVEQTMDNQRQLLRDVSHELRTPLARIQVAASLAAHKYGDLPETDRIEHEVERLDGLIEDLLTLSRLQNQTEIPNNKIDLNILLHKVAEDANFEFQPTGKKVIVNAQNPVALKGDYNLLSSALENVVRNALRFTPDHGSVEVRLYHEQGAVTLEVIDDGPGVNPEVIDRIFDPFFRADPSRDISGGQHGIGLALTQAIVKLHGGSIGARNGGVRGLVITVQLPIIE